MKKTLQVSAEKYKMGLISILLTACCLLTYYFHTILKTDLVFTHLFYIPIILAALWWQWKGFFVAIFLGAILIFTRVIYVPEPFYIYDCFRVLIFVFISYFVIMLSQRITRAKKSLLTMVQNSPYGVALVDQNDRHLYLNREFTRITGYTIKDIPTKEDWVNAAYLDPDTRAEVMRIWRQVPMQDYVDEKFNIVCKGGDQKIIRFRAIALNDARILLTLNDITDSERLKNELAAGTQVLTRTNAQLQQELERHRQTEKALGESEKRFRSLVENAPVGLCIWNSDKSIEYVNPKFTQITGYTLVDIPDTRTWYAAAYPDKAYRNKVIAEFREIFKSGRVKASIYTVKCKDRQDKVIRFNTVLIQDGKQLEAIEDITPQAEAETALKESQKKYQNFFNNALVGLYRTRISDGAVLECNQKMARLFGYDQPRELIAAFKSHTLYYADANLRKEFLALLEKHGRIDNFETLLKRRDGSIFWGCYTARIFADQGYIEGVITDVSDRKQAETQLRESKATFQAVVDGISDALFMLDQNLVIRMSNQAARAYYQLADSKEILGRLCFEILQKETGSCQGCKISSALKNGGRQTFERYSCANPDRYVKIDCYPIQDEKELKISGTIVRVIDMTEQKQVEEQLLRADRLSSLGQLSAGIAHEIRNPLASISLYVDILSDKEEFEFSDQVLEILSEIKNNVNRMSGIIKQVLNFARPVVESRRQVDINDIIEETVKLWLSRIRKTEIALKLTLDKNIPKLFGDPIQIQQVINNLILNALEAMTGNGVLAVSTLRGRSSVLYHRDVLIIKVADTGCGIESKNMENVFNPFFTTKPLGTGLGLSISHRIVQRHGGIIRFKSTPGQTVFTVEIPVTCEN
jgi:PAS domain S-box-containing protein